MNPQGIPTTNDSSNLRGNTLNPRQGGEFTTDGYPRPTVLPWIRCKVCADTSSTVYRIDARMHVREIPGLAITEFLWIFHFRQHCFPSGPNSRGMPPVRGEKHVAVLLLANPYRSVVNSTVERKRRWRRREKKIADNGLHGYQDEQMATQPLGNLRFLRIVLRLSLSYPNAYSRSPCPFPKRAPAPGLFTNSSPFRSFSLPGLVRALHETRSRGPRKFPGPATITPILKVSFVLVVWNHCLLTLDPRRLLWGFLKVFCKGNSCCKFINFVRLSCHTNWKVLTISRNFNWEILVNGPKFVKVRSLLQDSCNHSRVK